MSTLSSHNAKAPEVYSRRVLLCVAGMSPQVITETLYALIRKNPPFVPTEIQLVTTSIGARMAHESLISKPRVRELLQDQGRDAASVAFSESCIHVPNNARGEPLDDLRTEDDNASMANSILRVAADITADDDAAIHASIAGGRKTMSYYLGQVMSLIGRSQDTVSHVLINQPFEKHPEFFYPPSTPTTLQLRRRGHEDAATTTETANTADANIDLAFIPFVRLQARLPKRWVQQLHQGASVFTQAVEAAQLGVERPQLLIDLHERRVYVGRANAFAVDVTPGALCLYTVAAARRIRTADDAAVAIRRDELPLNALEMVRDYADAKPGDPDAPDLVSQLMTKRDPASEQQYYDNCAHEIRYALITSAGPEAPETYGFLKLMRNAYGLFRLQPEDIQIRWPVGNELDVEDLPWD